MSRDQWESAEPEWEVAVDKKKINRAVRRERKEAEAEAAGVANVVGAPQEEFNAEERRRIAAASFYGKPDQRKTGRAKKHLGPAPTLDFEEAGWTGGYGDVSGKGKKSKSKAKAAVPTYSTAEELYDALSDLLSRIPPSGGRVSSTLASLGERLATLTKQPWNKRFKAEFGPMRSFLQARPDLFTVQGDEVSVAGGQQSSGSSGRSASGAKGSGKSSSGSSSRRSAGTRSSSAGADDEDDSESGSEDDEEYEDEDGRSQLQREPSSSGGSRWMGFLTMLLVVGGVSAALVYTGVLPANLLLQQRTQ